MKSATRQKITQCLDEIKSYPLNSSPILVAFHNLYAVSIE